MLCMTLNGVTFRWDEDRLIITTSHDQQVLNGSEAAQLFAWLASHQQAMYAAEQARDLPGWTQQGERYVNGQVIREEEPRRLPILPPAIPDADPDRPVRILPVRWWRE